MQRNKKKFYFTSGFFKKEIYLGLEIQLIPESGFNHSLFKIETDHQFSDLMQFFRGLRISLQMEAINFFPFL